MKAKVEDLIIKEKSCVYGLGLAAEEFSPDKIRYLRISDIDDNGNLLDSDKKSVTCDSVEQYKLQQNDLVVARTGNSTGRTYMYSEEDGEMVYAGFLIKYVFDDKKINPRYMKYYCQSKSYKDQISAFAGSTRGNMSAQDFLGIVVYYPERGIQDKMVELFDFMDSKIKNNNKINTQLESMAKSIYDYWFLQFEFPNKEGKPYKSSDGKMVWNEELKREIPEAWDAKLLFDIAKMEFKSVKPVKNENYNHYSIPAFDENSLPAVECGTEIDSNKYLVSSNAILVSKLNPQFKRIWNVGEVSANSICSTEFIPFFSIDNKKEFLYSVLNSDPFYRFMVQSSSSSTGSRKRMQPELCMSFNLALPKDSSLIDSYCEKIKPCLEKIIENKKENQELASLRDFLLPLLMNGQVGFKE